MLGICKFYFFGKSERRATDGKRNVCYSAFSPSWFEFQYQKRSICTQTWKNKKRNTKGHPSLSWWWELEVIRRTHQLTGNGWNANKHRKKKRLKIKRPAPFNKNTRRFEKEWNRKNTRVLGFVFHLSFLNVAVFRMPEKSSVSWVTHRRFLSQIMLYTFLLECLVYSRQTN